MEADATVAHTCIDIIFVLHVYLSLCVITIYYKCVSTNKILSIVSRSGSSSWFNMNKAIKNKLDRIISYSKCNSVSYTASIFPEYKVV